MGKGKDTLQLEKLNFLGTCTIKYALTYDLEYIMRYIVRVILSNNCTRRSRVQLFDKMTRTIYLIMYERSYVNVFNTRLEYRY